ncbi:MAG: Ig-like domain-containing protein [Clostridia bacterium]|nr:Ig-like domain-containing protein [Clostridia bacterium]
MHTSVKKLCCVVCAIALLMTCAVPGLQGFAAAVIGLQSDTRDATPQADIYGLRNLIELSDALDLTQLTAPQSDIDAFQTELAQAKAVEQNGGASAAEINAAYNALGAAYAVLTPIIDPDQVFTLRSGGLVYYDQVSVGLTTDYRNVSQQYSCLTYPYESLIRSVRWSSSNPNVSVSADGVVTPTVNDPQVAQITVTVTTYDGRELTNNPTLNVCFAKIHTSGLTFGAESMTGYLGETGKISYTLSPQVLGHCTANIQDIIWSSTNSEDVSVDSDGTLHFNRASGPELPAAVITATAVDGGYSANCWVYVDYNRKALQQKINEANQLDQTLYTAESWQPVANALAQAVAVNEKDFYTTSSQQEIDDATAALSAAMQALQPLATIDSIVITHDGSPAAKYNSVKVGTLVNYASQSFSLGFTVSPADAAYQSVTWSSSDTAMSVDQNGTVKPVSNSAAAAKITVTVTDYNGRQFSDWVYVSFVKTQATGVTLNTTSLSMTPGSTASLTATVAPQGGTLGIGAATIKTVIWETSDPTVATVNGGTVTAVDGGTAEIRCITADGGYTATCSVAVTVDKTALNQALFNANSYLSTPYTADSYAALQAAIQTGSAVYSKEYPTTAEVSEATNAINDAINGLQIRPANYTALYQAVSAYEALTPDRYTTESFAAVQQAINNVVYDLPYTDQARVDAMAQAITNAIAQLVERAVPHLTPAQGSSAVVDETNHFVYGVLPGMADVLPLFTTTANGSLTFTPAANGGGTGSIITMKDEYGDAVDTFTLIVFGDVNGDVWYDGTDAYFVKLVVNGMISENSLTDAQRMACDVNHDGAITEADAAILEQAGLLLDSVDQTLPDDQLQTNSVYLEYCGLIDQVIEFDEPAVDQPQEEAAAEQGSVVAQILSFIRSVFTYLFNLLFVKVA